LMSESDYPYPQHLQAFRDDFDEQLRLILEDEANRTRTLDYKASFHILDRHRNQNEYTSESENVSILRGSYPGGINVVRRGPRFNLEEVLGQFEKDKKGNSIIIKKI